MATRIVALACATCGVTIRRGRGLPLCRPCVSVAERAFRRCHSPLDRDWLSARTLLFGDTAAVVALVRSEVA
jgi:hypothetical protein